VSNDLITLAEAARIANTSPTQIRYYRDHARKHRLTPYADQFGRSRLSKAEVLALKEYLEVNR
jgi:hypothetical protein